MKYFVLRSPVFESREELSCPQYVVIFRQYHEGDQSKSALLLNLKRVLLLNSTAHPT